MRHSKRSLRIIVLTLLLLVITAAWGLPGEWSRSASADNAATFAESLR